MGTIKALAEEMLMKQYLCRNHELCYLRAEAPGWHKTSILLLARSWFSLQRIWRTSTGTTTHGYSSSAAAGVNSCMRMSLCVWWCCATAPLLFCETPQNLSASILLPVFLLMGISGNSSERHKISICIGLKLLFKWKGMFLCCHIVFR